MRNLLFVLSGVILFASAHAQNQDTVIINLAKTSKIIFTVEDPSTSFDNEFFIVLHKPASIQVKIYPALNGKHPIISAYKEEPGFKLVSTQSQPADAQG